MISVVILGAGNVAMHLYKAFAKSDSINVKTWYNRDIDKIKAYKNNVAITDDLNQLEEADIYIMAVSDDAIEELSSNLPFENKFVVHTSGSVSIHALDKKHRRGVLYPIQTLSKDAEIDFSNVPLCLETLEKSDLKTLENLAEAIGSPYYKINTEQRKTLHLVAVFINNFTNQLYRIGHEISDAKNIDFNILKPLILETAKKVQNMTPYLAQTGPAIRNDKKTIKSHLKLIENEQHKKIYQLLTQSIQQTHGISTGSMTKKNN
ncbi:MAG TPA: Rossmann-like and DUF2520 domain-containing protein [Flavobacteriaceae bacterium]|nr:Rossmann-like and DUF2520 domain-containing protein [Flavobacteriaceae bacterium]